MNRNPGKGAAGVRQFGHFDKSCGRIFRVAWLVTDDLLVVDHFKFTGFLVFSNGMGGCTQGALQQEIGFEIAWINNGRADAK
jgi:hypothetical protein